MLIGVPRELLESENRVAATPKTVQQILKLGFDVIVEHDAGFKASFEDQAFIDAGAKIGSSSEVWHSDVIFKVNPPTDAEIDQMKEGATLVSFIWRAQNPDLMKKLTSKKINVLAMDSVPRISRAQALDALSSMANISGYRAVIEAAHEFGSFFTGQITAAGKVPPAKVLVIGAGVAGLAAIGAANSLGAIVRAFDSRPEVKEQVQSMGASFLEIDFKEEGKRIKIDGINARKLAIAAITVVYPIAGIAILLIPKRQEIKNDLSFTKDEIKALKADNVVVKTNSKGERTLHQRDKDTNEIVSIKAKDIHIPQKLGGIELTPMQQENLKNGKEITIVNEELNKAAKVKLDLNARNGLSIKDANTIEIKATEKKEQTIGKERYISDKERLEFVAQKGAKGIDEIFKDKPTEMAAFLEKHKLSKDYASYKEVEKTYSSSREATKQTVGEQISTQMDKIDSSIKATAKQEASILGYGRTYGKNNDTPTMKL